MRKIKNKKTAKGKVKLENLQRFLMSQFGGDNSISKGRNERLLVAGGVSSGGKREKGRECVL